jgi:GAF domain-containing protein
MQSQIIPNMDELLEVLLQPAGENSEISETLYHIANTAQTFLGADACVIFPINPITGRFFESLTITSNYILHDNELSAECLRSAKLVQTILEQGLLIVTGLQQVTREKQGAVAALTHLSDVRVVVALALHVKQLHKPMGVLYLLYRMEEQFIKESGDLFTVFANHASFILQDRWLQHRYQEVARIGQDINHELSDADVLFTNLKGRIGSILNANYAFLLAVYQPQGRTLDVYHAEEGHLITELGRELDGACQYVIETGKPLIIRMKSKEAEHLPFSFSSLQGTGPQESLLFVPLMLRGNPIGVLSIQHPEENAYTQEDQFILELLANHVALALHNARLYRSLNQLYETGQVLTQQFDSEQALQTIVDNIKAATRANVVILYPYHQDLRRIQPPRIAGTLLAPKDQQGMYPTRPGDMITLALSFTEAIFAHKSADLYFRLQDQSPPKTDRFYQREKISSTAVVPLCIDNTTVGVLFVNFRQPQSFDKPQKLLIEGLAHYASIALKSNHAFGTLSERHLRELLILQKIDQALNNNDTLELGPLLQTILKLAQEHISTGQSSILLYNARKRSFTQEALTGSQYEERVTNAHIPVDHKGIIAWVVKHKKPARVNDVHHDLPWRNIYVQAAIDTISELDVPLMDGDEVIGVLNFESPQRGAFHQEDERFLVTLAGQAVLAIKKAQAYERERRSADRFRLLYKTGSELAGITTLSQLEQAYQTIIDIARELSKSPVVIRRYDEETQVLYLAYASPHRYSPPSEQISLNEGFNGWVARERKTLAIKDVYELEDEYPRPADPTIHSLLITPIMFKDEYYGNLELSHEAVAHFRGKDKEFFEGLAQQLASTLYRLEITQERQELEQRAQAAEVMVSMAQSTYEITHRLGNDLGLVEYWVHTIEEELQHLTVNNPLILRTLNSIKGAVSKVMELSESLRTELRSGEDNDRFILLPPRVLLEDTRDSVSLPSNIEVVLEIEEDVAPVRVIHKLIADALRNLVINAKEAMPEGGQLTLRARNVGRSVALEVIDTGPGISVEHQAKIFDLFFSTKLSTGFGLWSARRNALKNRGTLEVKSELNKGTTFTLLLPKVEEHII